jgi:hypothetical protein
MADFKLEERDDGVAIGVVGKVMLVLWRDVPTAARMQMLTKVTERMLREHADGFYQVQVIEANSPPPASEQRKESARLMERMRGSVRGIAFVIEGDGARSAIVRTILRGMAMLSRGGAPKQFFAHVKEALAWLGPAMELSPLQLHQVERSIDSMRRSLSTAQAQLAQRVA